MDPNPADLKGRILASGGKKHKLVAQAQLKRGKIVAPLSDTSPTLDQRCKAQSLT
jgi:hypothetical protein